MSSPLSLRAFTSDEGVTIVTAPPTATAADIAQAAANAQPLHAFDTRFEVVGDKTSKDVVVYFCGKGSTAGHTDDELGAGGRHAVTQAAIARAEGCDKRCIFVSAAPGEPEFQEPQLEGYDEQHMLVKRTSAMIDTTHEFLSASGDFDTVVFKLFSYGASYAELVFEYIRSNLKHKRYIQVYVVGSGKTFEADRWGCHKFEEPRAICDVKVIKSSGDRWVKKQYAEDAHDASAVPSHFEAEDRKLVMRTSVSDLILGPLKLMRDGNFLIVQKYRSEVIKAGAFHLLEAPHAFLGGAFLVDL